MIQRLLFVKAGPWKMGPASALLSVIPFKNLLHMDNISFVQPMTHFVCYKYEIKDWSLSPFRVAGMTSCWIQGVESCIADDASIEHVETDLPGRHKSEQNGIELLVQKC